MRIVGIVVDVDGKYFAKDKDGNIRKLKVGDKIYEGETLIGESDQDRILIESPLGNEKITLLGTEEYIAEEFGYTRETMTPQADTNQSSTTTKPSDLSQATSSRREAIGFEEMFLSRDGEIINVEASLLDTGREEDNQEENSSFFDRTSLLPFNPAPTITTNTSEVQDNFYDTHLASGTDTVKDSFTFEVSGLQSIQVGDVTLSRSEVESLNNTPVVIVMQAGTLTLDAYEKIGSLNVVSYTYKTSDNYLHETDSNIFPDTVSIVISDISGKEVSAPLVINVIDDMPEAIEDVNSIKEDETSFVSGNVFTNDFIGADDETQATPVTAVFGGTLGTKFYGTYGELLLNSDGSYTYYLDNTNPDVDILDDDEIIHDIFTYTITDGDGDTSTTTLDIRIEGNSPAPDLVTNLSQVQDNFYDEHLASGTNTAINSFSFEALSGFASLQVGNSILSESEMQALNDNPVTINMQAGVLLLDGYTKVDDTHTISYTYKTSDNYLHSSTSNIFVDSVTIVVTDTRGKEDTDSLVINVIDDLPQTLEDTNNITEGVLANTVSGNVFTNDFIGADNETQATPVTDIVGGTLGTKLYGLYGELSLNANGSYTYYLDNTNLSVKILVDGEVIHDIFTYTITDGDSDTSSTTLDIAIAGNSENPILLVEDATVYESGLNIIGTQEATDKETATGTIKGIAQDGFTDLSYTSGGNTTSFSLAELTAGTFVPKTLDTPLGTITFTGFTTTSHPIDPAVIIGIMNYSYTLNLAKTNAIISDNFDDVIEVSVTDANGDISTENLTISIIDDKPFALDDTNSITEDAVLNIVSGNVLTNDNDGADTNANPIIAQNVAGLYGEFVLGVDGAYTYTLDNDNPAVNALETGEVLTDTLIYTIEDADGDKAMASLEITINGFSDPDLSVEDVTVLEDGSSGDMKVIFTINMDASSLQDVSFDYSTLAGTALDGKEYIHLNGTATIVAGQTQTTVVVTLGADDYVADSGKTFDLQISNVNSAGVILDAIGTATIEDNSQVNTPYNSADAIEDSLESITLKVVATDSTGVILGTPNANTVVEGENAYYKVIVVDANGDPVLDKDGNPASGTVNVIVSDGTALATNLIAGMPGDYDGTSPLTVNVNSVFEVQTTDDWIDDDGENFSVAIDNASGQSYSHASDYENVIHDTTVVLTTITDDVDTSILSINGDATVIEDAIANYTLNVNYASEVDLVVTVTITHIDTDNLDVVATTQNVTILAGQTTANFTIDTLDDSVYEGDEDYKVSITSHTGGDYESLVYGVDNVVTSITDNEAPPELSIADIVVAEDGDSGNFLATFTVTLSGETKSAVYFTYNTSDGSAIDGKDYTAVLGASATILGTTGNLTTTITIPLNDDYIADDAETFTLTLSNPSANAVISATSASAIATINDDSSNDPYDDDIIPAIEDSHEGVTLKLIAVDENGVEGGQTNTANEGYRLAYKVIVVDSLGNPILDDSGNPASGTVNIEYTDTSATGGIDYVDTLMNVTVNEVFYIPTINDAISDDGEVFTVNIKDDGSYSNAAEYEHVTHNQVVVTSTINDAPLTAVPVYVHIVNDASITEADGAVLSHSIEFRLADGTPINLAIGNSVTINLVYTNDATVDADFQTKMTTLTLVGDGSSSYNFSNLVADDFLNEGSESYTLGIASVVDTDSYFEFLIKTTDTVTGTISDETSGFEDAALVSIISDQTIVEGQASHKYIVSVDQAAGDVTSDIVVTLTYSGLAIDGVDYIGQATVTIPAGSNFTTFRIPTINDDIIEGSESFTITIDSITDTNFEAITANPAHNHVDTLIIDDVSAHPEIVDVVEGSNIVDTPNLLSNDESGTNGIVSGFSYVNEAGVSGSIGIIGTLTDTQYGQITVNADGSWTYTSDPYEEHGSDNNTDLATLEDIISYTITDDNGDSSDSTLTINVQDTIATTTQSPTTSVDEDNFSATISGGDLGINMNQDPIDYVAFDQASIDNALSSLTSGGVSLTYTLSYLNHTLTAYAGGVEIFVVMLNQNAENSTYDFELKGPLDHPSTGEDILNISIPFEIKETGANEDIISGNISVDIVDDIPIAVIDMDASVIEGGSQINGNVLTNDIQGADTAELYEFTYKDTSGVEQTTSDFGVLVHTATGDLTVNQDGSWTFTPLAYIDHNDPIQGSETATDGSANDSVEGSFGYKLIDGDGDISNEITQTIHVLDGANPVLNTVTNAVDEDDLPSGSDTSKEAVLLTGTFIVAGATDPIDTTFTIDGSNTLTSDGVNITYTLSDNGHTLTGMAGSKEIFIAKVTGDATLDNPSYSFELKAAIDHPSAGGENTQDLVLSYVSTDIDDDEVASTLTISITDDIPSVGTPDDGYVDESGLVFGSSTDHDKVVDSGTLDVLTEADTFDTVFDSATITALEALSGINNNGIESNAEVLSYTISNSSHTLTASTSKGTVFTVEIVDYDSINASYNFELFNAIDHAVAGSDETLSFNFSVNDVDGDSTSSVFDVVIHDDVGSLHKDIVVDEDSSVSFGITADDIVSFDGFDAQHGTVTFDDASNLFTYTPNPDYSGDKDTDGTNNYFTIHYTTAGGAKTVEISATINPISDKPTIATSGALETDEDSIVFLGLIAPIVKDDSDANDSFLNANDVDGDNPELLGAITLSGFQNTTELHFGSTVAILNGGDITIQISDLDENADGVNDHVTGLITDYTMTKAEFEAMAILAPLNSGDNIDIIYSVTSFEVDDGGSKLTGVSGKTSSQTLSIDVHAKTDDGVDVSVTGISGDEDNWIRIDSSITITKTLDVDGSEKYSLVFEGTNIPSGTLYYLGTPTDMSDRTIGTDASAGFSIEIPDIDDFLAANYPIYIMTPINDSTDITDLKVTVNVWDTDSDSTPATDIVKSASDYIDITVVPIANDITVSGSGSGDEDTAISLNLVFDNQDMPLEKIVSLSIDGIPADAKLLDNLGNEVSVTAGSATILVLGGDTTALENYSIIPPAHSSEDITLQVTMTLVDKDDNNGSLSLQTITTPVDILIEVLGVTEKDSSDSADPSGLDITQNASHIYTTMGEEDSWFNLNTADGGFSLSATNEDDQDTNPYGSEETFVVFSNAVSIDQDFNIVPLDNVLIKFNGVEYPLSILGQVKVPIEYLNTVEIKAPANFAGTLAVETVVQSQDFDEDTNIAGSLENSEVEYLVINVLPVAESTLSVSISQSVGNEDSGRDALGNISSLSAQSNAIDIDIVISSNDTDGSEKFTLFLDEIPEDAAIYFRGHLIYANSANDFASDGIIVSTGSTANTFKLQLDDYSSLEQGAKIIPAHNSDDDITLKVSAQIVDTVILADGSTQSVLGVETAIEDAIINVNDIADLVINTQLRTWDIIEDGTITSDNQFTTIEKGDGSGAYNAIITEDNSLTHLYGNIEIREIYSTPNDINSYDNLFSNQIDNVPIDDATEASEIVSMVITNLAEGFALEGATLISGTGTSRIWSVELEDLKDGSAQIITPQHFSGEVNFDVKFLSTENAGNVLEGSTSSIKVLVTPSAEDLRGETFEKLEVNEDTLTAILGDFVNSLPDDNGNPEELFEVWINKADITAKEFSIFYGDINQTLINEVATNPDIRDDGAYYVLTNNTFLNLYIQYKSDLGESIDTTIDMKYTIRDYIDLADGQTIGNVSVQQEVDFEVHLNAVTDDIDAYVDTSADVTATDTLNDISDVVVDANGNFSVNIKENTNITVHIDIAGEDTAGEVDISTATAPNTEDYDGSEVIVQIRLNGVPKGVSIQDAFYVGDIESPPGSGIFTGIWHLNNPQDVDGGALTIDGTADVNLVLEVYGDNSLGHEVSGTIVATFINQDGLASTETDNVTIHLTDIGFNPSPTLDIPMDILEWNVGTQDIFIEDTPTRLGDIINFSVDTGTVGDNPGSSFNGISGIANGTAVTSSLFSITVEGIENATVSGLGWTEDNFSATPFYTFKGEGDASSIQAALDALIITPNQDYNENHDSSVGDTNIPAVFDEGALNFTTTFTTYADGGFSDVKSLDYSGNVSPVTDDLDLSADYIFVDEDGNRTVEAFENGVFGIAVDVSSVDSPYVSILAMRDVIIKNVSPDNVGVIVADNPKTDESLNGEIRWNGSTSYAGADGDGWVNLDVNSEVVVPLSEIDTVEFKLDQYISGTVNLEYSAQVQENGAATATTQKGNIEFYVNPIADGLELSGLKLVGQEDEYIEIQDLNGNSINSTGTLIDPTEELISIIIEGVPNGYLVFYGNAHQDEATVIDVDAKGNITFNVPISNGVIPQIWVLPPENVGGVTSLATPGWENLNSLSLVYGVDDMGVSIYNSKPIHVNISAVADDVSISPVATNGIEGDDIAIHLNATVIDSDESEKLIVTLHGIGANAVFKLAGLEIDSNYVTYNVGADIYTISNSSLNYTNIAGLSFVQNNFTGDVDVTVQAQENSNLDSGNIVSGSFHVSISQENATSGNDILFFDEVNGNNGLAGEDSLVFGHNYANIDIDFTSLDDTLHTQIETLDLVEHGDHSIIINTTDVEAMTDLSNSLTINSDAGDSIKLLNDGDNVWARQGSSNVLESTNGAMLTVNGAASIDIADIGISLGNDVLGYNNTNSIDASLGDDRLIIFEGVSVDFSKITNIETIDLSVKGDHNLGVLSLSDVLSMTDSRKTLIIEGNDANDKVSFEASDGWTQDASANGYTSYINSNDPSVLVKVNDTIDDQMI